MRCYVFLKVVKSRNEDYEIVDCKFQPNQRFHEQKCYHEIVTILTTKL